MKSGRLRFLTIPIILAAFSLLTAGYLATLTTATVVISGETQVTLKTHQTTVGSALQEAGIVLQPEDVISPEPTAVLNRNDTIIIQRARLVQVTVDDLVSIPLRTQARTADELLSHLGVTIGKRDRLTVNGQPSSELPLPTSRGSNVGPQVRSEQARESISANIRLIHAKEITIQEEGSQKRTLLTAAPTVGEALMEAGYKLYLADQVIPGVGEALQSGTNIVMSRSHPLSILVDGRRAKTRTSRLTVGDVLADMNIVLYGQDYALPALEAAISDNLEIRVVRVRNEVVINQEVIPFETRTEPSNEVELDTVILAQGGQPGVHEIRTVIRLENNTEVSREVIADYIAQEPMPRLYNYGTKVVVRSLNTENGVVRYWRVIHMLATSYSASTAGTSLGASYYGKTRCGDIMRHGIVAVDPDMISLHTNVYVPGYGAGYACDTGNAIVGKRIDLGYDDNNLKDWYNWVDVYLLTPVPNDIDYTNNK